MTAGMRPEARSFFDPPRRASERGLAFNGTDFIFFKLSGPARLTRASALKFKQRIDRRIVMDSFDGFAQKPCDGQCCNLDTANCRAKDSISCNQFVNDRFSQSF